MPYAITYDSQRQLVETRIWGACNLTEAQAIIGEALAIASQQQCWTFLTDCRAMQPTLSIIDIYALPAVVAAGAAPHDRLAVQFRRAVVAPEDQAGHYQFFETVSLNQHQSTRIFQDIDQARAWLMDRPGRPPTP